MAHMKTILNKSDRGRWTAKTSVHLFDKMHLSLYTGKGFGKYLETRASVSLVEGNWFTHRLTQDFHKSIIKSTVRCTQQAVERQHNEALAVIDKIKSDALSHYNQGETDVSCLPIPVQSLD
jgi:hypothetical protein